jgi:hypothetical protein
VCTLDRPLRPFIPVSLCAPEPMVEEVPAAANHLRQNSNSNVVGKGLRAPAPPYMHTRVLAFSLPGGAKSLGGASIPLQ